MYLRVITFVIISKLIGIIVFFTMRVRFGEVNFLNGFN